MIEPQDLQSDAERRVRCDRRAKATPAVSVYWLRGRRRDVRRQSEIGSGYYVDHPGNAVLAAIGALGVLGILDGVLTLQLMARGAIEANPLMAFLLSLDVTVFLGVKYALTLAAALVLLMHQNFALGHPRLQVRWLIALMLSVYVGVVAYEVTLFDITRPAGTRSSIEVDARTGDSSFRNFS